MCSTVLIELVKMKVLFLACCLAIAFAAASAISMVEKFAWKDLDFSWPSDNVKEAAIQEGSYVRGNNLPLAFDVWRDKIFLTVPRCYSNNSILLFMRTFKAINYTFLSPTTNSLSSSLKMETRGGKHLKLYWNLQREIPSFSPISKLGMESVAGIHGEETDHRL